MRTSRTEVHSLLSLWDVMPYTLVPIFRRFAEKNFPPFSRSKTAPSKQASNGVDCGDEGRTFQPKRRQISTEVRGVTS
jgi:hypothetical protein